MTTKEKRAASGETQGAKKTAEPTLEKHPTQPMVTRLYDARTRLDRRKKLLLDGPWLQKVLDHGRVPCQHRSDGVFYEIPDPVTGVARMTSEGRGVFRLEAGHYGLGARPGALQSEMSATSYDAEKAYSLVFGDREAPLDEMGVPKPQHRGFVATRFRRGKVAVGDDFVRSVKLHRATEFAESDFEALWICAFDIEDAAAMLTHEEFDSSWWAPSEVDNQLRPLTRWITGVTWSATDESAYQEARREIQAGRELEFQRRLRLVESELRRELGL